LNISIRSDNISSSDHSVASTIGSSDRSNSSSVDSISSDDLTDYNDIDTHYSGSPSPIHTDDSGMSFNDIPEEISIPSDNDTTDSYGFNGSTTNSFTNKVGSLDGLQLADDFLVNADMQVFRNARNRVLSSDIQGRIMKCVRCGEEFSTDEIINNALKHWRTKAISDGSTVVNVEPYPFSKDRMDLWAMNYSYDMADGCIKDNDPFFGNRPIRDSLMHDVFDRHDPKHRPSCFKKGPECRHYRPEVDVQNTTLYYGEETGKVRAITWSRLVECDEVKIPAWTVRTKRPMGCQYLNTYNKPISEVFCCNTNIQIGDRSQVYYCTLYCGKSTQKDDAEKQNRLNVACSKRILRIQEEILLGHRNKEEIPEGFPEGLSRMLSAMNAAQSRDKISVCMQHRLVLNGGTRFKFSHGFGQLLVGQLEARLKGEDIKVRIRYNNFKGRDVPWQDAACDHYLFRPNTEQFEDMCPYYMAMHYKSISKTKKEVEKSEDGSEEEDGGEFEDINAHDQSNGQRYTTKYSFTENHPGQKFCQLAKLRKWVVPKVYTPKDAQCRLKYLKLHEEKIDESTEKCRESYAKTALLMFYPYRRLSDLKRKNSYWKKFHHELEKFRKDKPTKFWNYGFEILQNIEDRQAMDENKQKMPDFITDCTKDETPAMTKGSQVHKEQNDDNVKDILEFCSSEKT